MRGGPTVRLQKVLAEAGLASRRGAARLVADGRVAVNGRCVTAPGLRVNPLADRVTVDGAAVTGPEPRRYIVLHKLPGYLTTRADPRRRPCVFDLVPDEDVRLHAVGRLDLDAEGLLLLTNDGALTYRLTHPRYGVARTYHVLVHEEVDDRTLAALRRGVMLEDGLARPEAVACARRRGEPGIWLTLVLREGRYREVKRLCRAAGLRVRRLIRVQYGPVRLGRLRPGAWREVTAAELLALRRLVTTRGSAPRRARSGIPGMAPATSDALQRSSPGACAPGRAPLY